MKRVVLCSLCFIMAYIEGNCQVKIGSPGAPHPAAILELESTSMGFMPPRMTTAQRNAIANPPIGSVIYNIERFCIEVFTTNGWRCDCDDDSAPPEQGQLGSTFTAAHGVATAPFSNNTLCNDKVISAGYISSTCKGSITLGTHTYFNILINGQCWLNRDSEEFPDKFGSIGYTAYTIWYNGRYSNDIGHWGYFPKATAAFGEWASSPYVTDAGYLYQWSAAMNGSTSERAQGVCPSGYHVPSDCEWKFLEHGLGMSISDQNKVGDRSSGDVDDSLSVYAQFGTGLNSTNWSGLITGIRFTDGEFDMGLGYSTPYPKSGFWWTSSLNNSKSSAFWRSLSELYRGLGRLETSTNVAIAVRCLKN